MGPQGRGGDRDVSTRDPRLLAAAAPSDGGRDRRRYAPPVVWVVVLLVPAYLLGTFPTAHLIVRAHGRDVTQEGSGNPGASNVGRLLGWRWGVLAFLGDAAKGALPAGVGLLVQGRAGGYLLG